MSLIINKHLLSFKLILVLFFIVLSGCNYVTNNDEVEKVEVSKMNIHGDTNLIKTLRGKEMNAVLEISQKAKEQSDSIDMAYGDYEIEVHLNTGEKIKFTLYFSSAGTSGIVMKDPTFYSDLDKTDISNFKAALKNQ
ncbi:hypothetical protein GLW08_21340 [Pontibacillus yanchengensis]|uniref:YhfM-like domain-containing protein n=2 Tax=Pontibacillus yanchengensis TaxID=462910 RepID=A0A6I5A563_9BACI|nr:hypothetical protein [Pontibacillus yanchengensis]MYL35429.1 hypothetical protein [Pontibacillus yanchengensis]MYL55848.1 hypothetical protein [Pontibacillus yanchengensis]